MGKEFSMKNLMCFSLLFFLLVTACAPALTPAPTFAPFPTSIPLTPTSTPPPAVLAGTPIPLPDTVITAENVSRLTQLAGWGNGTIVQIEASPDGSLLAVGTPLGIHLYDVETFTESSFIELKNWLNTFAFSPDGTSIATGELDGAVQIWGTSDGKLQKSLYGSLTAITSLAFSRAGNMLAAGGGDGTLILFDIATQAPRVIPGQTARIHTLIFSPDGETLISGSDDLTVRFIQFANSALRQTIVVNTKSFTTMALSSDGSILATGSLESVTQLWRVADGNLIRAVNGLGSAVLDLSFSDDEDEPLLAIAFNDNSIMLRRAKDGAPVSTLNEHTSGVNNLDFSPDGKRLYSGSYDGTVRTWQVTETVSMHTIDGFSSPINSIAFSPLSKCRENQSHPT